MQNPSLSIIIPTHKRAKILAECIAHIEKQTIVDQLEVIVVSDGHDPETEKMMQETQWSIPAQFFTIEKAQQGAARNEGVKHANADLILFIGDDMFMEPDCAEKHITAHKNSSLKTPHFAVLGFTTWDPRVGITPVMEWLEKSGWQFGYPMIKRYKHDFVPPQIQHRFTYTSNISVPTEIAKAHPFLHQIQMYGWEDIEWGHRKRKAGIRLFYEPDAKVLHHHHITLDDSLKRMETLGKSLLIMEEHVPDLSLRPTGVKLFLQKIQAMLPTMAGKHRKAFLRGLTKNK